MNRKKIKSICAILLVLSYIGIAVATFSRAFLDSSEAVFLIAVALFALFQYGISKIYEEVE